MTDGDVSCDYCGVDIDQENDDWIDLMHFAVTHHEADTLLFQPPEDACLVSEWGDLAPLKMVHLNCVSNYFDGIHASIPTRKREALGD